MRSLAICWLSLLALLVSCTEFTKIQKSENAQEKYAAAIKYYEKQDYYRAGLLLEEVAPMLKGTADAEKAHLMFAYCHYYQGDLIISAHYFKRFNETYPRSQFAEEALFMHCKSLFMDSPKASLDQTNTYLALLSIDRFLKRYPKSTYTQECSDLKTQLQQKLETKEYNQAKLYLKTGYYKAAIVAFSNFRRDYPNSKYNEELAYLKVVAQYQYAEKSVHAKRVQRYHSAIDYYYAFVDQYPGSKYVKQAENLLSQSKKKIEKLSKTPAQ